VVGLLFVALPAFEDAGERGRGTGWRFIELSAAEAVAEGLMKGVVHEKGGCEQIHESANCFTIVENEGEFFDELFGKPRPGAAEPSGG
jgi:hypothetical protein